MEEMGDWFRRLYKHMGMLKWERVIRDGDKYALEGIHAAIAEWMSVNKPPLPRFPGFLQKTRIPPAHIPGRLPPNAPFHLKPAAQLAEEAKAAQLAKRVEKAGDVIRLGRFRSGRNLVRGSTGLLNIFVGLGTGGTAFLASKAGLVFLSKLAARWYIEDKILDWGTSKIVPMMIAIDEATMPSTAAEAERMYDGYVRGRHHRVTNRGELLEWDEPGEPMPREVWLAETYGINWSVLH